MPAVLASDDFSSGSLAAGWAVSSGQNLSAITSLPAPCYAEPPNTSLVAQQQWHGTSWPNDQTSELTLHAFTREASTNVAIAVRMATGAFTGYVANWNNTSFVLYYLHTGTFTQIGATASSLSPGDVITLAVVGTSITVSVNGTPLAGMPVTHTLITSGEPGFRQNSTTNITHSQASLWRGLVPGGAISGNAGVAGATVSYSGQQTGSVTADGAGAYSLPNLANGSYTVTPSKASYTFSPVNSAQTVSGADIAAVNFTASSALSVSSVVVNGSSDVTAGTTFSTVVTLSGNVTQNTGVVLATTAGESLGGTTTGTITTGNNSVTINGCALFVAATGKVLSATQTSGDAFTSGNSSAFNVLANTVSRADTTAQGTPVRTVGFSVLVTSTDGFDNTAVVSQDTAVALTLGAGTGVLSGTLTGTITSGTSSVTISGVVYSKAEVGVTLIATSTSGDSIGPLGVHNAFTVGGTVATPTFSPIAGSYVGTTNVTVLDTDSGQSGFAMYYTTDGSTPTTSSTPYTTPISVATSETIKVLAIATGMTNSAVASAAYTISAAPASGSWTQGYRNFINKR